MVLRVLSLNMDTASLLSVQNDNYKRKIANSPLILQGKRTWGKQTVDGHYTNNALMHRNSTSVQ